MIEYFEVGGRFSDEFDLYIDANLSFNSPEKSGEFIEIKGKNGEIFLDNHSFKNVNQSFPAYVITNRNLIEVGTEISNWLKTLNGWQDLVFSGDPDYIYRVMFTNEYETTKNVESYSKTILTCVMKPTKFLDTGRREILVKNNQVIKNNQSLIAHPILKIKGSGNIKVKINDQELNLKGVDEGIIVDCLNDIVTDLSGSRALWNKVTNYPLPFLETGKNKITFEGNVTKFKLTPNWEVLVG